jgi:hypothetical protein
MREEKLFINDCRGAEAKRIFSPPFLSQLNTTVISHSNNAESLDTSVRVRDFNT